MRIAGPDGERVVPLADLHRVPGDTPAVETQLEPGELIVAIDFPPAGRAAVALPEGPRPGELRMVDRLGGRGARLAEDGTVRDARVAVGGVATKPWRLPQVEAALRAPLTADRSSAAAARAADGAVCTGATPTRSKLIRRTVARALDETGALA